MLCDASHAREGPIWVQMCRHQRLAFRLTSLAWCPKQFSTEAVGKHFSTRSGRYFGRSHNFWVGTQRQSRVHLGRLTLAGPLRIEGDSRSCCTPQRAGIAKSALSREIMSIVMSDTRHNDWLVARLREPTGIHKQGIADPIAPNCPGGRNAHGAAKDNRYGHRAPH